MSHHRHASTSSYDPVLIRPAPSSPTSSSTVPARPPTPRLKYPYPLPVLALLDLGYTIYVTTRRNVSGHFLPLCLARSVLLCGAVGASKRWRFRGGWVAGMSGVTVLAAVWEVCKDRLDPATAQETDTTFLLLTALLAIAEYLLFLLLLRLSPAPHRLNPLSLRLPRSAIQTPTAFHYSADMDPDESDSEPSSPTSPTRRHSAHRRQASQRTARTISTYVRDPDELGDADECGDVENGDGGEMLDDLSDSSSISESSIIDLPPAQDPARIIPPASISIANLNSILSDEASVIGPLVRRTRSARLLAQSWGSGGGLAEAVGNGTYGTFGFRSGQGQSGTEQTGSG